MPYYHAFIDGPFASGSDEIGIVRDRPISFKEKLGFGPRSLFIGRTPLIVDIMSHEEAVIRATRDVTVVVESHDKNPEDGVVTIDQTRIPALLGTADDERVTRWRLEKGQSMKIRQSSLCIQGKPDEQLRWSSSMESCVDDFFDRLTISALHRMLQDH